jgi:hypothetical protein
MMATANGTATMTSWVETPPHDAGLEAPRLAHALVEFAYEGDLVATSTCHYVLAYRTDGIASFRGLEQITGDLQGVEGSFIISQEGTFAGGAIEVRWTVLDGSGTGSLVGLRGTGGYAVAAGEGEIDGEQRWRWSLDFER